MGLKRSKLGRKFNAGVLIGYIGGGIGIIVAILAVVKPELLHTVMGAVTGTTPHVEGTLHASGDKLGAWELAPTSCRSGEPFGFHGVILFDEKDDSKQVRLAREPAGSYAVTARVPGTDDGLVLRDCETMEVRVARTNTMINEVWSVEGTAKIECGVLKGDVAFEHCH